MVKKKETYGSNIVYKKLASLLQTFVVVVLYFLLLWRTLFYTAVKLQVILIAYLQLHWTNSNV